jgi:Ala-tRNA(Pro) deacylase
MERFQGRPASCDNRLDREMKVYNFLDDLSMTYERVDHLPAENMEVCEAINEVLKAKICKNLFLCNRQQTKFYLLMMPGNKPFKTKELSAQIQSARLSFASPEKMLAYLDIEPGAVSVMGLINDSEGAVTLLIDEDILKDEYIGCHPCVNTASLKIKTDDLLHVFLPAVNHGYTTVHLIGEA